MNMKALGSAAFALAMAGTAGATVYGPGPGGAIPDGITDNTTPGVFNSIINVPDNYTIGSVNNVILVFGPNHTWAGDIQAILTAPNGDNVHLFSRVGDTTATGFGDSSDLAGPYTFTEGGASFLAAATAAASTVPIPSGAYARSTAANATVAGGQDMDTYAVFAGDNVNGNWTLTLKDWVSADTGSLVSWTLDISPVPTPGALALLGLAGLFGAPRRRRA